MLLGNYLTGVVALFAESGASQWRRLINLLLSTEQRYADFTRSLSSSLKKLAFLFLSLFLSLSLSLSRASSSSASNHFSQSFHYVSESDQPGWVWCWWCLTLEVLLVYSLPSSFLISKTHLKSRSRKDFKPRCRHIAKSNIFIKIKWQMNTSLILASIEHCDFMVRHVDISIRSGQFNFGVIYRAKYFKLQWNSIPVNVLSDLTKPLPYEFTYLRVNSLRERELLADSGWKWVNYGIIWCKRCVCVHREIAHSTFLEGDKRGVRREENLRATLFALILCKRKVPSRN